MLVIIVCTYVSKAQSVAYISKPRTFPTRDLKYDRFFSNVI